MITESVKLIIWDLDDTFWRGTLAEGGIEAIPRNIDMVRVLAARGIISSICSKNDFEQARRKLLELDIYDWFVFPSVSFESKGPAIASIIEAAGLRAENTLFIDDNILNREEVKFFNPGIMAGDPVELLEDLLDHPKVAGKPDPELKRLGQYRLLQRKFEERKSCSLSNEEFLRGCGIQVRIDYDVETNFDRVVELINRTNQLNYTKRRLDTAEEVSNFRAQLNTFGMHAGCVFALDKYGDYGLVGFFQVRRRARKTKLVHFLFSCRTMNMGIEQYVFDAIGRPELNIVTPVSNGLDTYAAIDWINSEEEVAAGGARGLTIGGGKLPLVLLGGCDLLQLASYCSTNRLEFVNTIKEGVKVRYDDPGFVLSDRNAVRRCETLRALQLWTAADCEKFDTAISDARIIILSMWPSMMGKYFRSRAGVLLRMSGALIKHVQSGELDRSEALKLGISERLELICASFDAIARSAPKDARIFILGCPTQKREAAKSTERLRTYNARCAEYCSTAGGKFHFIDVDTIVPGHAVLDELHFSREGYFAMAVEISRLYAASGGRIETTRNAA